MKKNEIKFTVGNIGFQINWEDSWILDWPIKFYNGFTGCEKVDVNLLVRCKTLPDYEEGELIFDAGYNWKLFKNNGRFIFVEYDVGSKKKDRVIFMDLSLTKGEVYITPDNVNILKKLINPKLNFWSIHRLIDPFLKIILANKIITKNGLMVHGLSVLDNDKGVIFAGRSGAGKSTLANMFKEFKGIRVVNDEKTILLKKDNNYYINSTPWPGDALTVSPVKIPLNKIYFIKHSNENEVNPMSEMSAFNMFFPQLFLPFWDKALINIAMEFVSDLILVFKPQEFGFLKEKSAVDFIRRFYAN